MHTVDSQEPTPVPDVRGLTMREQMLLDVVYFPGNPPKVVDVTGTLRENREDNQYMQQVFAAMHFQRIAKVCVATDLTVDGKSFAQLIGEFKSTQSKEVLKAATQWLDSAVARVEQDKVWEQTQINALAVQIEERSNLAKLARDAGKA
jgi:hypothetical protein